MFDKYLLKYLLEKIILSLQVIFLSASKILECNTMEIPLYPEEYKCAIVAIIQCFLETLANEWMQ